MDIQKSSNYNRQTIMIKDNIEDNQDLNKIGFFAGEAYLRAVFKKTERIVAGLYLVTGLLKDKEPLKWKIREHSMTLLSSVLTLNDNQAFEKDTVARSIFSDLFEIISAVNLAHISGLLSDMNHEIMRSELDKLMNILKDNMIDSKEKEGYVLSEKFFNNVVNKSQKSIEPIKDTATDNAKKVDRKIAILEVLKNRSNLTVKDVAQVVTGCSEKTIQRELIELVEKGVVKREGERRWSRYSLR